MNIETRIDEYIAIIDETDNKFIRNKIHKKL
jgi:hypothetical protein